MLTMYILRISKIAETSATGSKTFSIPPSRIFVLETKDPLLPSVYRDTILGPASNLRKDLVAYHAEPNSTSDPRSPYWKAIWLALTNTDVSTYTLSHFDFWINQQIIPKLENTILASEELQRRDAVNSPT